MIVSPAKKLDFESVAPIEIYKQPEFLETSKKLIKDLKKLKSTDLQKLMGISENLAQFNLERYQNFKTPFDLKNSKQAIFAFKGDTYIGLDIDSLDKKDIDYADKNLRILSGLYGVLKPLDLMQAYRLEMGTSFGIGSNKNLYELWRETNTRAIESDLKGKSALVNLASKEYFSSIDFKALTKPVITPVFKEEKNGKLKIISFNAKRARGMMANFIIKNKIKDADDLENFNMDNYKFDKSLSSKSELVFRR
jgi:cytoplasmic iron level regulating protein YaaA (DUF328/UPF0246 family)